MIKVEAKLDDLIEGMAKFYEYIAIRAGLQVTDKTMFRCTKIEVSKEIDDFFWKYYRDNAKENNPNMDDEKIQTGIAMLMLQNGAKRNDDLEPWCVQIEDGFAFEKED